MNYDKVYDLARDIKESDEFRAYAAQKAKVDADPNAKRMLEDFRKQQLGMEMRQMQGEAPSQADVEQLRRLYETINMHTEIRELFASEQRLIQMVQDIQRIIAEPFQGLLGFPETEGGT
ncbi:YlbF family regulator [Brevibacillus humidisoli]|uniref:YlbF family regulator n=1 Tax=Brevibacillus humidisoli TaxID=2895522 RepID=UPI001E4E54F5|nr:YlbF family regulator [Brevibacillus humidisoli]UFJ41511.1 YlbF family regulator [Brevibacillus humidisoli]